MEQETKEYYSKEELQKDLDEINEAVELLDRCDEITKKVKSKR